MHPDLKILSQVAQRDDTLRRIQRDIQRQRERVDKAASDHDNASKHLAELLAQLEASKTEEHRLQRRLEQYTKQRDRALRALETGTGDPFAAEKQLAQCTDILDDSETAMLEVMEQQDDLVQKRDAAILAVDEADAALATARQEADQRLNVLNEQQTSETSQRQSAFEQLPHDIQSRYEAVRKRHGFAVAWLDGDACTGCRMAIQPQRLTDLRRGLIHACTGCHRWVVPAPKPR